MTDCACCDSTNCLPLDADGPAGQMMADAAPLMRASNHQHPDHDTPAWPVAKE